MISYLKRAPWFTAGVMIVLFYNVFVLYNYHTLSNALGFFSTAIEELSDAKTRFSFEPSGNHGIWLLLPQGAPKWQTVQGRNEVVRKMSLSLGGKKVESQFNDVMDGNIPETHVCGDSTLTYLAEIDASGKVEAVVKTLDRYLVPRGSKIVVERSPPDSDGEALVKFGFSIMRNHLGMTDAIAALALVIIGIFDITPIENEHFKGTNQSSWRKTVKWEQGPGSESATQRFSCRTRPQSTCGPENGIALTSNPPGLSKCEAA